MQRKIYSVIFAALAITIWLPQSALAEIRVVASIKPVHSLVAAVMDGVATPSLIVKGIESVHDYQLKPSDAQMLENADFIVWVGPSLESSIVGALANLPKNAEFLELSEISGLRLYEFRESHVHDHGDEDEDHDEEEEDHEEEGEHGEEGEEEEDHEEEREMAEKSESEDDHGDEKDSDHDENEEEEDHDEDEDDHDERESEEHHDELDMHVWLDVRNAKLMTKEIANALANSFPAYADQFRSNMDDTIERLEALEDDLESQSRAIKEKPYIVFHDAYQYLEKWLDLDSVAAVTLNPEILPGVGTMNELKEAIHDTGAVCAFAEPQFNPGILHVLQEGTDLSIGMLDPLGASVEPGSDAYFQIMRNMLGALRACLL